MRTRHWYRLAFVALIFAVLSPLFLLNAMGILQPEQGLCLETGFYERGDPATQEEAESDFFVPPELVIAHESGVFPGLALPVCRRSMRGEHRFLLPAVEGSLRQLGEPNLVRVHISDLHAQILRVLTRPSFSEHQIAMTLVAEPEGRHELRAAWLDERYAARNAPPIQSNSLVSLQKANEIWRLGHQVQFGRHGIDGNWLVIEMIEQGERSVRYVEIDLPEEPQTQLFCELVKAAHLPVAVLQSGGVDGTCT